MIDLVHGLYVRRTAHLPSSRAIGLGHVAVPVVLEEKPLNRRMLDLGWYERVRGHGCKIVCWSWFCTDPAAIREAIAFAASVGAVAFMINGEKELRGQPLEAERIAQVARKECDKHGMLLGLVSYSIPKTVRDFPWAVFARYCDFGQPECYDRFATFDPEYDDRARAGYLGAGFRAVLDAGGAYQKQDDGTGWRWRTPAEIDRHVAQFDGRPVTLWTLGQTIPRSVVQALVRQPIRQSDRAAL